MIMESQLWHEKYANEILGWLPHYLWKRFLLDNINWYEKSYCYFYILEIGELHFDMEFST